MYRRLSGNDETWATKGEPWEVRGNVVPSRILGGLEQSKGLETGCHTGVLGLQESRPERNCKGQAVSDLCPKSSSPVEILLEVGKCFYLRSD